MLIKRPLAIHLVCLCDVVIVMTIEPKGFVTGDSNLLVSHRERSLHAGDRFEESRASRWNSSKGVSRSGSLAGPRPGVPEDLGDVPEPCVGIRPGRRQHLTPGENATLA